MKPWMKKAYELGQKTSELSYDEIVYGDLAPQWCFDDFEANVFFESGRQGYRFPIYTNGWRYGNIPECGRSFNYREGRLEKGVSVMQLEGQDKVKNLAELRGSFDNRPIVKISGYINPIDVGGDGEPLLVCCNEK